MEDKAITNFDLISTKEEFLKDTDYIDQNFKSMSADFFDGESVETDMSFIKGNKPSDNIF
jgi:hypothetical protein